MFYTPRNGALFFILGDYEMNITTPSKLNVGETNVIEPRKPAELTPATDEDELIPYITALKQDCPIESATLIGVAFHKKVFPVESGYARNQDKPYMPQLLCRLLTETQVEEFTKRAKEVFVNARIQNPNFDFDKKISESNSKEIELSFYIDKYLLLCKASEYNPIQMQTAPLVKKENIFDDKDKNKNVYNANKKKR